MSITLDIVCTDNRLSLPEVRQKRVRAIGEILPFVFAKYGIRRAAVPAEPLQNRSDRQRRFEV